MEARTLTYVEGMRRFTRATAERIRQKKERALILNMAQRDDVPRLTTLFNLWDSLPYIDKDEKPAINALDGEVTAEQQSLVLPSELMGSGDARVADWLSKLPIPQKRTWLIENVNVLPPITEEDQVTEQGVLKKFSLRKLFRSVGRSIRRSFGQK